MLKDLKGKSVYELRWEEFDVLFCRVCREKPGCDQDFKTMNICQQLVDDGMWDKLFRMKKGK